MRKGPVFASREGAHRPESDPRPLRWLDVAKGGSFGVRAAQAAEPGPLIAVIEQARQLNATRFADGDVIRRVLASICLLIVRATVQNAAPARPSVEFAVRYRTFFMIIHEDNDNNVTGLLRILEYLQLIYGPHPRHLAPSSLSKMTGLRNPDTPNSQPSPRLALRRRVACACVRVCAMRVRVRVWACAMRTHAHLCEPLPGS